MVKVAIMQLASCWGCNQSLVDSHLTLLHLLPELEFVYWPAVVDFKLHDLENYPDQSVDFGFLEGFCRTQQDIDNVNLMRKKCKVIVAMGSCAVLGGCPGLANLYSIDELVNRKFMDKDYVDDQSVIPSKHVPQFLDKIPDLHEVTKVDADLPGCPPKSGNIIGALSYLVGTVDTKVDDSKNMCEVCPLDKCLLDEGKLCYGPITAVGTPLGKIADGHPVLGEFGLTKSVHAENCKKLFTKLTSDPLTEIEVQNTVETLMMTLNSIPLGYLQGTDDALRSLAMFPEKQNLIQKEGKQIIDFTVEGYADEINDIMGAAMAGLKNNPHFKISAETVCSQCERNVEDKTVEHYKRDYEGMPDPKTCLLVQGYVCMGPVTKAGCGATCIRANSPCLGCYGPALNVEDYGTKSLGLFPSLSTEDPEKVKKFFSDPVGLFNRFCLPTSKLNEKIEDKN